MFVKVLSLFVQYFRNQWPWCNDRALFAHRFLLVLWKKRKTKKNIKEEKILLKKLASQKLLAT